MSIAQPQQFPVGPSNVQIWNGQFTGEAQVTVLNGDPSQTIYIGNMSNFSAAANSVPVKPSATVTVDGRRPWFVSGPAGTANCTVIPGSIQYSPGTSIVTDLIAGAITLPFTITNGNFLQTSIIATANFESFNCIIRPHTPNVLVVGAPFTAIVQFNWYADAAGTIPLFIDDVTFWSGGPGSGQDAYIRGPVGGPYLQVTIAGANPTSPIVIDQFLLYGNPTVITTVEARQSSVGSGINQAGFLLRAANDLVFGNIAASFSLALAGATNYIVAMPLMPGEIFTQFSTTAALASPFSLAQASGLVNGAVTAANPPGTFYNPPNTAGVPEPQEIIAPRSPMYAVISTAGATTVTFTAMGNGRAI